MYENILYNEKHFDSRDLYEELKDLLIGRKIIDVQDNKRSYHGSDSYSLYLNNGYVIIIETNTGCGACCSGWSEFDIEEQLYKLPKLTNAIVDITLEQNRDDEDKYRLHVFTQNDKVSIDTDDGYGNGWYGGGFYVTIKKVIKD
jgi:hypothetical protein